MAGRRCLRGGKPRLLGKHNTVRGRWYSESWASLVQEFGPLTGLARLEAGRVAVAWVNVRAATAALEVARLARERETGRRPSSRDLERFSRRQGLAHATYSAALDKLREMVNGKNGHGGLAHAIQQAAKGNGAGA